MSGHSHWATIKHKKGAIDAKRGKLWSKLSRAIIIAAKNGGGDLTMNCELRLYFLVGNCFLSTYAQTVIRAGAALRPVVRGLLHTFAGPRQC